MGCERGGKQTGDYCGAPGGGEGERWEGVSVLFTTHKHTQTHAGQPSVKQAAQVLHSQAFVGRELDVFRFYLTSEECSAWTAAGYRPLPGTRAADRLLTWIVTDKWYNSEKVKRSRTDLVSFCSYYYSVVVVATTAAAATTTCSPTPTDKESFTSFHTLR